MAAVADVVMAALEMEEVAAVADMVMAVLEVGVVKVMEVVAVATVRGVAAADQMGNTNCSDRNVGLESNGSHPRNLRSSACRIGTCC